MEAYELLRRTIEILEASGISYFLVGSMASSTYGHARLTLDVDLVVALPESMADVLCDAFPAPEFYVSRPAILQAIRSAQQFNVLQITTGLKVDFMLRRRDAWGNEQFRRRQRLSIRPDMIAWCASPEDIILGKMIYYQEGQHEKHLRDIAGMLSISGARIDRNYVTEWAATLGVRDIWARLLADEKSKAERKPSGDACGGDSTSA